MLIRSAIMLLLPLAVAFMAAEPAEACHRGTPHGKETSCDPGGGSSGGTFPATEFLGWLCEVDLLGLPAGSYNGSETSQYTTSTRKLCTGSNHDGNIHISCEKLLGSEIFNGPVPQTNVSCDINRAQCDETCGTASNPCVVNVTGKLSIDSTGLATLQCSYNGPS